MFWCGLAPIFVNYEYIKRPPDYYVLFVNCNIVMINDTIDTYFIWKGIFPKSTFLYSYKNKRLKRAHSVFGVFISNPTDVAAKYTKMVLFLRKLPYTVLQEQQWWDSVPKFESACGLNNRINAHMLYIYSCSINYKVTDWV